MDPFIFLEQLFYFAIMLYTTYSLPNREYPLIVCKNYKTTTNIIKTVTSPSIIRCGALCLDVPLCFSVNFVKSTSSCQLSENFVSGVCASLVPEAGTRYAELDDPCLNGATWNRLIKTCTCVVGYVGTFCHRRYRDCTEVTGPGNPYLIRKIQPLGTNTVLDVYCDADGSTIFVNLLVSSYPNTQFQNRLWQEFKTGFNDWQCFFNGLEALHQLTQHAEYYLLLLVRLVGGNLRTWVRYSNFRIGSEAEKYPMYYDSFDPCFRGPFENCNDVADGLSGNGDNTKNLNGSRFGTFDDDAYGCAAIHQAGFWYDTGCSLVVPDYVAKRIHWPLVSGGTADLKFTNVRLYPVKFYTNE